MKILIRISLLTMTLGLHAQYDHSFERFTTDNGLPHSDVTEMIQDNQGFLWIGTFNGLCRFDGDDFKVYNMDIKDSTSISSNRVRSIFQNPEGKIFVGTEGEELNIYDPILDQFTRHSLSDYQSSKRSTTIYSIFESGSNKVYLGTERGLNVIQVPKGTPSSQDEMLYIGVITTLVQMDSATIWAGGRHGIFEINDVDLTYRQLDFEFEGPVKSIVPLDSSRILIGTEAGLYLYQGSKLKQLNDFPILAICLTSDSSIWVGTNEFGLLKYDFQLEDYLQFTRDVQNPKSIGFDAINSLVEDHSGVLWIGTLGGAISKLNLLKKKFKSYSKASMEGPSLTRFRVNCFYQSKDSLLWVGLRGGGINVIDRKSNKIIFSSDQSNQFLKNQSVSSFYEDPHGALWIGYWGGLTRIFPEDQKTLFNGGSLKPKNLLPGFSICKIISDYESHLWLSTTDGLHEYIPSEHDFYEGTFVRYNHDVYNENSLSNNFIRDIYVEKEPINQAKVVWVGTRLGLNRMEFKEDGIRIKRYYACETGSDSTALPANFIVVIHETKEDTLIISALGGGVAKMINGRDGESPPRFELLTSRGEPISKQVETILEDDNGNLWFGGEGLSRYNISSRNLRRYNVTDGLQSNSFKVWAALKTADGEMIFGGTNGFNVFHPDKIIDNKIPPKLVFTEFKIDDKKISVQEKLAGRVILDSAINFKRSIILPYPLDNFSIKFAALHYPSPQKNRYRYRLEGVDNNWITSVGKNNSRNYSNLNPGRYTFLLNATNGDGYFADSPIRLDIQVLPPIWATKAAFFVYAILILVLLYLYRRYSIIGINEKNKLLIEKVKNQQWEKIQKLKLNFFTNISHEIRTPLTLIKAPVEELKEEKELTSVQRSKIDFIDRNVRRLKILVDEIMDFRKYGEERSKLRAAEGDIIKFIKEVKLFFDNEAANKNISYRFESKVNVQMLYFDRDALEKVLFNLLSNAFKFTPDGGVIRISCNLQDNNKLKVEIFNSGSHIKEDEIKQIFDQFFSGSSTSMKGTGIGLALAKSVIDKHKGRIWAQNEKDGVSFLFTLKLGDKHLEKSETISEYTSSEDLKGYMHDHQYETASTNKEHAGVKFEPDEQYTKKMVLIVEDNSELRTYLYQTLSPHFHVIQASNGKEGVKIAFQKHIDLIISDVMMPEMDGISMCREIKSNIHTSHIPVLLLTARTSTFHQVKGYELGADSYLTKPFSVNVLIARTNNLIESREKLKQLFNGNASFAPSEITVTSIDQKVLEDLVGIIEDRMSDSEMKVKDICKAVGMSRSQLYRKVKSITSLSINEFIRSIRIKRAAQLLRIDNSSVAEVMHQVGFNNSSYFSKAFKAEFGTAPKEFGKRCKEPI